MNTLRFFSDGEPWNVDPSVRRLPELGLLQVIHFAGGVHVGDLSALRGCPLSALRELPRLNLLLLTTETAEANASLLTEMTELRHLVLRFATDLRVPAWLRDLPSLEELTLSGVAGWVSRRSPGFVT